MRRANLKAETINLLCYKCHAEKQGPFAFPHPPVTRERRFATSRTARWRATYCGSRRSSSALRCHIGHNGTTHPRSNHGLTPTNINARTSLRQPLYTNCTQCHTQIHGTDLPAPSEPNASILTR